MKCTAIIHACACESVRVGTGVVLLTSKISCTCSEGKSLTTSPARSAASERGSSVKSRDNIMCVAARITVPTFPFALGVVGWDNCEE